MRQVLRVSTGCVGLGDLAGLMGHESVETNKSFYAVFEKQDLRRKHEQFSGVRWGHDRLALYGKVIACRSSLEGAW